MQTHGVSNSPELISITTAIYCIGCFLGAIAAAIWGDVLGRKRTILVGTSIMAVGAALKTTSYSLPQMIVGRIVAGIGNGLNTSTAPIWQADSAKSSWRGRLVVIECVMNIAGFSLVNWISEYHVPALLYDLRMLRLLQTTACPLWVVLLHGEFLWRSSSSSSSCSSLRCRGYLSRRGMCL